MEEKVNRGAGYGLVSSVYHLYGPKIYLERMKQLTDSLRAAELMYIAIIRNI